MSRAPTPRISVSAEFPFLCATARGERSYFYFCFVFIFLIQNIFCWKINICSLWQHSYKVWLLCLSKYYWMALPTSKNICFMIYILYYNYFKRNRLVLLFLILLSWYPYHYYNQTCNLFTYISNLPPFIFSIFS